MSDRSATAQMALDEVARTVPRLDGFGAWRSGASDEPYLTGGKRHAVALVLIHDPRDARVRSTTLIATPQHSTDLAAERGLR